MTSSGLSMSTLACGLKVVQQRPADIYSTHSCPQRLPPVLVAAPILCRISPHLVSPSRQCQWSLLVSHPRRPSDRRNVDWKTVSPLLPRPTIKMLSTRYAIVQSTQFDLVTDVLGTPGNLTVSGARLGLLLSIHIHSWKLMCVVEYGALRGSLVPICGCIRLDSWWAVSVGMYNIPSV